MPYYEEVGIIPWRRPISVGDAHGRWTRAMRTSENTCSETVRKMGGGLSSVLLRLHEATDLGLLAPLSRLRNPDSAPIPIFQTVSPRTWVNKGKQKGRSAWPRPSYRASLLLVLHCPMMLTAAPS